MLHVFLQGGCRDQAQELVIVEWPEDNLLFLLLSIERRPSDPRSRPSSDPKPRSDLRLSIPFTFIHRFVSGIVHRCISTGDTLQSPALGVLSCITCQWPGHFDHQTHRQCLQWH
jgi:hypothetical protein